MKFTVYSKNGCPYCTKIEQVLNLKNLDYQIYKLNEHFTTDQFYSKFGYGSTFPQVVLNENQNLGGCTDTVKFLQENKIL
jgi:glutaredoxin 3